MSSLNQRIDTLQKEIVALTQETKQNEEARLKLLNVCQMSMGIVPTPEEQIWQMLFQPLILAAIRTSLDIGLFDILNKSEQPVTAADLAKQTKADQLLITRLLRPLASIHVVIETGFETYTAGPICKALSTSPILLGSWKFIHDVVSPTAYHFHAYLQKTGYHNPVDPSKSNFQYSHHTDLPPFPWLMQHPQHLENFLLMLEGSRQRRADWFEIFPVKELLLEGFDANEGRDALLVDVGGANGYEIQNFKKRFQSEGDGALGKLVLQDLPDVIDGIKELDSEIVRTKHDFFTPQPEKDARAYYMRNICHDWPDNKVREILSNIVSAMKPGYSRLLINDWVIPDTNSPLMPGLLDINMMVALSGMERTESHWKELLGSVGLEVRKFWSAGKETEGLIECVRK